MNILGISCYYHDASAALMKDGRIVAAAQEERFTRRKHDTSFPVNSIRYCLKEAGLSAGEIDYVGFYEKPFLKFERVLFQHLEMFPFSFKTFVSSMPSWINQKLRVVGRVRRELGYKGAVLFVEHHLAHAAGSFLVSPFESAAIVTIDGVGEWTTTAYGFGAGSGIELKKEIRFPHSLGLLYSAVTAYLGFSVNNSEYKVMGLAPYGRMDRGRNEYYKKLRSVVDLKDDGSFFLDMKYFVYHFKDRMPSGELCRLLGGPVRRPDDALEERHKDIAAAVQLVYEDVLFKILGHVHKELKCDNLVISGGCGLNSVANGKILGCTPFKRFWCQPDPGDGGTSIGVASYIYNVVLGNPRSFVLDSAYLGPGFSGGEIRDFLEGNKIKYSEFKGRKELLGEVVKLLAGNKVVGWFQGRMEWGPRALGCRSILANPMNPEAKELLNEKVKHREKFRPFAPVVCEDDALKYFECDEPVPEPADFMLMVYPVKKEWRRVIPSVTHVDGSGRLQTVRKSQNSLYYDLIKAFGRESGVPILINTSFNIRGEPIVCTPEDAYKCMMGTGIDCLVMDNFIIFREDNPQDMWNSEKYARD